MQKPFTTTRLTVITNTGQLDTYHASVKTALKLFGADVPLSAVVVNGIKCVEVLYTVPGEGQPFINFYKYRDMLADGEKLEIEQITEYPDDYKRITRIHFGHL